MVTTNDEVNWVIPLQERQMMLGWPEHVLATVGVAACDVVVDAGVPEIEPEFEEEIDTVPVMETVYEVDQDTVPEVDQDTVPEPVTETVPDTEAA